MSNRIEPAQYFVVDDIFPQFPSAGGTKYALLVAAGAPANNNTVTIGSVVYTYKTTLTPAANEVLIGGSALAAFQNLQSAINLTGTIGTDYGAGTTRHPWASATRASNADANLRVTGFPGGDPTFSIEEDAANLTWENEAGVEITAMEPGWEGMAVGSLDGSVFAVSGHSGGVLLGLTVEETGTEYDVELKDSSGRIVVTMLVNSGAISESIPRSFGPGGIRFYGGFSLQVETAGDALLASYTIIAG